MQYSTNIDPSDENPFPIHRQKRNIYVDGKRTSIAVESYVWANLEKIASEEGTTIDAICSEINAQYKGQTSLSSVIRYLSHEVSRLKDEGTSEGTPNNSTHKAAELHESPQSYESPKPFPSAYHRILGGIGTLY